MEEEKENVHLLYLRHGNGSQSTDTLLFHPRRHSPSPPTSLGPLCVNHWIRVSRVVCKWLFVVVLFGVFFSFWTKDKRNYLAFVLLHSCTFRLTSFNFSVHCTSFWLLSLLPCSSHLLSFYRDISDFRFWVLLHITQIVGRKISVAFIPIWASLKLFF